MFVTVKAILEKNGEVVEIRKFKLYKPAKYNALEEKIKEMMRVNSVELKYRDADEDLVSFSSNAELSIALESVQTELVVYVYDAGEH